MSDPSESTANPVTVAVGFQVKPGRLLDFERWAHDITEVASGFPGNQGASWVRTGGDYHLVYRFATHSLFHAWHESPERAEFLEKLRPIATLVADDHLTGLETWFELPDGLGRAAPRRWKMVVATWIGVFPLLTLLQWLVAPHLVALPLVVRVMVFALVAVSLMTYVVMPRLTLLLKRWLYPA